MVDRIPSRATARSVPTKIADTPIQRPDIPVPVTAWIINGRGRDVEIAAEAVAWTKRTVSLHYFDADEREGWVWVWASAVTRRHT
ncbi:hypothetical protein [Cellulomonas soli]|uniref:hypothetical protein n=1 Tax=Cellulomonas soli TaxID=931535 RepID=UPI0011BFE1DE|nr:hypothetical protein [Cellulomonas soli]NYI60272.1 hypothetical protein [Cellulomonas soli]